MLLEVAIWMLPSLEVMLDLFTDHKDVSKAVTYAALSRAHQGHCSNSVFKRLERHDVHPAFTSAIRADTKKHSFWLT